MAYDADAHTLVLPFSRRDSRRNSEDSIASSLSDAETELMLEAPPWAGDAMAPASSLQLYNLRRLLLGLDSPLGADNESEEGVEDNPSAQSDYSSDGEDEGHSWAIHGCNGRCPLLPRIMTLCTLQTCCRRS